MTTAAKPFELFRLHGGKVEVARATFPEVRSAWIDLSTGISPWAYPHERIAEEALTRLPDPEALAQLEQAAARSFRVADASCVIATPGSDLALRLLGMLFAGRRVAVVRPGYSGHVLAWGEAPLSLVSADAIEVAARDHDVLLLANPNNPDGRIVARERLLAARTELASHEGTLVVDEAFADVMPEHSVCNTLGAGGSRDEGAGRNGAFRDSHQQNGGGGMIVFRSFGKFFGLAGVRLGFIVATADEQRRFRHALGDWPVSGPAVAIGTAAYNDLAWQAMQRQRLTSAAKRLDALLTQAGFTIAGGTALFRLARCDDAESAFRHLASHGILTRPFTGDSTLLRIGLPADELQWYRLSDALIRSSTQ
jgi:cobalamin biosynthetic protein CobC